MLFITSFRRITNPNVISHGFCSLMVADSFFDTVLILL